jgi:hypothetical protein
VHVLRIRGIGPNNRRHVLDHNCLSIRTDPGRPFGPECSKAIEPLFDYAARVRCRVATGHAGTDSHGLAAPNALSLSIAHHALSGLLLDQAPLGSEAVPHLDGERPGRGSDGSAYSRLPVEGGRGCHAHFPFLIRPNYRELCRESIADGG